MIDISIVIPVYKVPEEYLRKCIDSAVNQRYSNFEVIIVDDGSPDNCGTICDEYKTIPNVKVIHKKNEGLSAARNSGFEEATGEWITFLDGDDWIDNDLCRTLMGKQIDKEVDIVMFGTSRDFENKCEKFQYKYENNYIYEGKNIQVDVLDFNSNIATAYAKLYKRSFLEKNSLRHNATLRQGAEGIEFNIRVFGNANKVVFFDEYLYHYRYNMTSISVSHNERNHYMVLNCFRKIKEYAEIQKNKSVLLKKMYERLMYVIITTAISGYFNPTNKESYKEKKRKYEQYLNEDIIRETLEKCDTSQLDAKRSLIIKLIRNKKYRIIELIAKIRYKKKTRN